MNGIRSLFGGRFQHDRRMLRVLGGERLDDEQEDGHEVACHTDQCDIERGLLRCRIVDRNEVDVGGKAHAFKHELREAHQ